jgi:hypothetical protein
MNVDFAVLIEKYQGGLNCVRRFSYAKSVEIKGGVEFVSITLLSLHI